MIDRPRARAALRRGAAIGVCALAFVAAAIPPGIAGGGSGRTKLASRGTSGEAANGPSGNASFSADGRFVAFSSLASNLVPHDINQAWDVFLLDRQTGRIERVSDAADGSEGNGNSSFPSISADGRLVAFESRASNLHPGDTDDVSDIYVRDLTSGALELISRSRIPGEIDKGTHYPTLSADGRLVCFYGNAANLVPGDLNDAQDVFVHDRQTDSIELVSMATGGAPANNSSFLPSMSSDGRFVAWESYASNLVPLDSNLTADVFVRDRQNGTTQRASLSTSGGEGDGASMAPAVSIDGRFVAFNSYATNLVGTDTNGVPDVFVRDLQTGTTELVSASTLGGPANARAFSASMSAGGRYIAFESEASNLVPGDTNGAGDIFLHDLFAGVTTRVSVGADGVQGNGASGIASVSPDGRSIAFVSSASNLDAGDDNTLPDLFVHEAGGPVGVGGLVAQQDGQSVAVSGWASFAPALVSSAADGTADALVPQPNVEITRAGLTYRPDEADLIVRIRLAALEGRPGIVYGMSFLVGGVHHEVRATATSLTGSGPVSPYLALYRCETVCVEQTQLAGGMGTGAVVVASLPLSVLEIGPGSTISSIQAFSSAGEVHAGGVGPLDAVALPDATIPQSSVLLALARAGTPPAEVVFDTPAVLSAAGFAGSLSAEEPGGYDVWARACLGAECATSSTQITLS